MGRRGDGWRGRQVEREVSGWRLETEEMQRKGREGKRVERDGFLFFFYIRLSNSRARQIMIK